jgi:WD40 repeat protein
VISGGDDAILKLWNSSESWSPTDITNVGVKKATKVTALAVVSSMRGGCLLAAATADFRVVFYDMSAQGKFTISISPHRNTISALLPFSSPAQGQGLISASHDGSFCVFILS